MLLLVVGPDAEAAVAQLASVAEATPARARLAAEAYLAGASFDAVAIADGPDADALATLAGRLGARVVRYATADDLVQRFAPLPAARSEAAARVDPTDARETLVALRDRLTELAHTLNNPLAVVVGNAQLAREVARATGADPDVLAALDGVEAGAHALAGLLGELAELRRSLDGLVR